MRRRSRWIPRALTPLVALAFIVAAAGERRAETAEPIRLYVFAGQSNMVGKSTNAAELRITSPGRLPSSNVLFWGPTADAPQRWGPLEAPTELTQADSRQGFGAEIGASAVLARRHRETKIAVVKLARNGTSLHRHWDPASSIGLYAQLINRVRYAEARLERETQRRAELAGFFWMQGEADAATLSDARDYGTRLATFIGALRRDLGAHRLTFVFGQIQDLREISPRLGRYSHIVRREQAGVAKRVPNAFMVSTDGLERAPLSPIHFSSRGTFELGRRFSNASFPL